MREHLVSTRFPYLPATLVIRDRAESVDALLDTGFTGYVAAPQGFLQDGDPPDGSSLWSLADGSRVRVPYYLGSVQLGDGEPIEALVIELGDEAILGREVMRHFRITLDHGERVIVEP